MTRVAKKDMSYRIFTDADHDNIIRIHELMAGESDETIAAACEQYFKSQAHKYQQAVAEQHRPQPRLVVDNS
jgi:hypothetical protein